MIFGFIGLFRFQKKFSELFMLSLMARMEGRHFHKKRRPYRSCSIYSEG